MPVGTRAQFAGVGCSVLGRPRSGRFLSLLAVLFAAAAVLAAPSEAASVRLVAALPPGAGGVPQIADVSTDGQRVLVTTSDPGSLWSVASAGATVTQVSSGGIAPLANQSPSGSYIAWVPRQSFRVCAHSALVAPADGSVAPRTVTLPTGYSQRAIDAVAVADDGSVTVRVGPCGEPFRHLALLTAAPATSQFVVRARLPSGSSNTSWHVSDNGRVFVGCAKLSTRVAQMSLIDTRAPQSVKSARLSGPFDGFASCVASDSGTGTLSVIRRRARHRDVMAVTTIGGARRSTVSLPFSCRTGLGLSAARSDGRQVIAGLGGARIGCPRPQRVSLIDTRSGRSRSFRLPFTGLGDTVRFRTGPGYAVGGVLWWDPFAPALLMVDDAARAQIFNPRTLRDSPVLKAGAPSATVAPCFLPSGRVLFAAPSKGTSSLSITDPSRGRLTPIDTTQTGPITSASCEAVGTTGTVFLSATGGQVYSVPAAALDGSALQVAA